MPYGHIKQYRDAVEEARKKRILITRQQERQIARLYADVAKDLGREISRKSEKTLTYRWLKDYGKSLKSQSRAIYSALQEVMESSIYSTASLTVDTEMGFWGTIVPELSERFRDTFSSIPQKCVNELMNGGIYKDFTGLSERLWNCKGTFDRDIGYIINRGIIEQKSAFDLAKDLELYLKPEAKKPWEWRKAYPHSSKTVDYSAQRLARTSVTHAYQLSFQRSTVDNPFIERYQWHSSNAAKTCELCRQRNGKFFEKERVPLDHPNGMCFITAEIPKSMDEIAEELADWAAGGRNPAIDQWLNPESEIDLGKKIRSTVQKKKVAGQVKAFSSQLRKVDNKNVRILLQQSQQRVIIEQSKKRKSRYRPTDNKVYLSVNALPDVLAHELMHEIDYTYGITKNGALSESLRNDYRKLKMQADGYGKDITDMLYSRYKEAFEIEEKKRYLKEEYRGLADILEGVSEGKIYLGYGHGVEYWKHHLRVESETWAQIGRMIYSNDQKVLELIEDLFPETYREFIQITERMIK